MVLKEGVQATEEVTKEIQSFVKTRLAAHEYPPAVNELQQLGLI